MYGLTHTTWLAESPAVECCQHQSTLQPVPQPGRCRYGSWDERRISRSSSLHNLPHHDSRVERHSGIHTVMECAASSSLHRTVRRVARSKVHQVSGFKASKVFFE